MKKRDDALHQRGERLGIRIADARRHFLCLRDQRVRLAAIAPGRHVANLRALTGQRQENAVRIARLQRQQHVLGRKLRAPERLDHAGADRPGPADVEAEGRLVRQLWIRLLLEAQPPRCQARSQPRDVREPCRPVPQHGEPGLTHERLEHRDAAMDVAAPQELAGGADAEADRIVLGRPLRGRQIRARCLRPFVGAGQRVAHALVRDPARVGVERVRRQRDRVQACGLVEGERLHRLGGGLQRLRRGLAEVARGVQVHRHLFGVAGIAGLEGAGQLTMPIGDDGGVEPRDQHGANAIVIDLQDLASLHQLRADQPLAEEPIAAAGKGLARKRGLDDASLDRLAGDGDELQQVERVGAHVVHARLDDVGEAELPGQGPVAAAGVDPSHDFVDEEWFSARLLRHFLDRGRRQRRGRSSQRLRQPRRIGGFERRQFDVHADGGARETGPFTQRRQPGTGGDRLGAVRQDEQDGRRFRAGEQIDEERASIHVAPLQVVDREHHASALRQPAEQLAQRRECQPPQFVRVYGQVPAVRPGRQLRKHREHAGEHAEIARDDLLERVRVEAAQMLRQVVDEIIEALVRHRLALVAAAA